MATAATGMKRPGGLVGASMIRRIFNSFAQILGYVVIIVLLLVAAGACTSIVAWCSATNYRDSLMEKK